MTVAIKSSLSNLNQSLQKLESSISNTQDNNKPVEKSSKNGKRQPPSDLFAVSGAATSNDIDANALASRLDGAIAKVEKLLREA